MWPAGFALGVRVETSCGRLCQLRACRGFLRCCLPCFTSSTTFESAVCRRAWNTPSAASTPARCPFLTTAGPVSAAMNRSAAREFRLPFRMFAALVSSSSYVELDLYVHHCCSFYPVLSTLHSVPTHAAPRPAPSWSSQLDQSQQP